MKYLTLVLAFVGLFYIIPSEVRLWVAGVFIAIPILLIVGVLLLNRISSNRLQD